MRHIYAPDANSIRVLGTTLTKGEDGYFTGVTRLQDPGFHYYTLNIVGADVADPPSDGFFGAGARERCCNRHRARSNRERETKE